MDHIHRNTTRRTQLDNTTRRTHLDHLQEEPATADALDYLLAAAVQWLLLFLYSVVTHTRGEDLSKPDTAWTTL